MQRFPHYLAMLLLTLGLTIESRAEDTEELGYNQHIRPILSDNCFLCHGPGGKPKAGLRLNVRESAVDAEREGGAAIVPGRAADSLLVERITSSDPDDIMPPPESHKQLSASEIDLLRRWIDAGAVYEAHWSFIPAKAPDLPESADARWNRHPVDQLVHAGHQTRSLQPRPRADKRQLIRRLSFDLTGLPPTSADIRRYLEDERPEATEHLVNRLLASPHYGEHMARYWLDLVRYGDTHGLHTDNYREMWKYRDWVIESFNNNLAFDTFTVEQLAGDLLPQPGTNQLVASGFNRLHLMNTAGSALAEELFVNNVIDRVNAVGTTWLGLTLGCAQCHDHKYDPISQREYYQLFAFFNNLDGLSHHQRKKSPAPKLRFPSPEQSKQIARLRREIKDAGDDKEKVAALRKKLGEIDGAVVETMVMRERKEMRPAHLLIRGAYDNPGEEVPRATPAVLPPMAEGLPLDRLGLARWLVGEDHPLTARVAVNRFWQQLFGVGLVKTAEDFGAQGEWPAHPELLDHLATRFVESGWDVKALMKHMVLSETYAQSATAPTAAFVADPDNRQLARGPRFRLDAEMIRDQALLAAGLLQTNLYGRSVKPPQPDGLWNSVGLHGSNTRFYEADSGPNIYRRSLYTFWKRTYPHPALTVFDAPSRETCIARRERTNTPLQALVLMNEPQYVEASRKLAERARSQGDTAAEQLGWAWEQLTGRVIQPAERKLLLGTLAAYREAGTKEDLAWTLTMNALFNLDIVKTKD